MPSIWPCGGFGWLKRSRFRVQGSTFKVPCSSPGDDLHNLQPVACAKLALGEFRWRHGFAVVLDDDAARQEILSNQKLFKRTREAGAHFLCVGDDGWVVHADLRLHRSSCERDIPIFPHRLIPKLANQVRHFPRGALIGDLELAGGSAKTVLRRGPLAGAQFNNLTSLGV